VKQSEFVRWLARQGVEFRQGKKHLKARLNGKTSVIPRHPSAELQTGTLEEIKKQLGLK
jgi:mRNA interferase HicA